VNFLFYSSAFRFFSLFS